jgi:uncharacterized membrane protein YdfJ with MMPL/SSD domain
MAATLSSVAHIIGVSGTTLAGCFLSLVFFPVAIMTGFGYGCALTVFFALTANLSLCPALLLEFHAFFSVGMADAPSAGCGGRCCESRGAAGACCSRVRSRRAAAYNAPPPPPLPAAAPVPASPAPSLDVAATDKSSAGLIVSQQRQAAVPLASPPPADAAAADGSPRWRRLGAAVTTAPCSYITIAVVLAISVPFALQMSNEVFVNSSFITLPRGALTDAFLRQGAAFGYGRVMPYRLLMQRAPVPVPASVLTPAFFAGAEDALRALWRLPRMDGAAMSSIVGDGRSGNVSATFVAACVAGAPHFPAANSSACRLARHAVGSMVNRDASATYAMLTLGWDPMSVGGDAWLAAARAALAASAVRTGLALYLDGPANALDAIDKVTAAFPSVVIISAVIVLAFTGVAFRSVLIPLQMVVTIGVTIAVVYGAATYVYQDGDLDWLGWSAARQLRRDLLAAARHKF